MQRSWTLERSSEPRRWDHWLGWWAGRRYLAVLRRGLDLLADDTGVLLVHPLLDLHFLAALAQFGGRYGFGSRTAATSLIFGGVLPHEVLVRTDKAVFTDVFWREGSRQFIQDWDSTGVDDDLVDATALRRALLAPRTDFRAASPLLSAFLASIRDEGS
jgi:asparagine synthase (glutamine-hydrolysing)